MGGLHPNCFGWRGVNRGNSGAVLGLGTDPILSSAFSKCPLYPRNHASLHIPVVIAPSSLQAVDRYVRVLDLLFKAGNICQERGVPRETGALPGSE